MQIACIDHPSRLAALKYAGRVALVYRDRQWTFAEFETQVGKLAQALAWRFDRGARLVIFMSNRAEFLLLQSAMERAGQVRVPINAKYNAFEVATILNDCDPAAIFCDSATASVAHAAAAKRPTCEVIDVSDLEFLRKDCRRAEPINKLPLCLDFNDLCSINYTSGTSGDPKGVMLSHRNWWSVARNMLIDRAIAEDDIVAHVGPLSHASGTYVQPFFLRGAASVIVDPPDVETLLETIERLQVTGFTCVPTVLNRLVVHPEIEKADLSSLRWIGYGGEPMPAGTLHKAHKIFGPILTLNYGLTEAMMTCTTFKPRPISDQNLNDRQHVPEKNCIGRPYSFVQLAIRRADGNCVATGEVGELTIKAEHVMQGYWNKLTATNEVLRHGWLWTGDLAWMDNEGFVYLAGRSKDMLISGGFNIYPAEVEAVVNTHESILESAVIGLPDPDLGEIAVAFVCADSRTPVETEELRKFCKPKLGIKTPKKWYFLDVLPRTANGKIDKKILPSLIEGTGKCAV